MTRRRTQAALRTERIELRPLSDADREHEVQLDSDPAVMRYLGNGAPCDRSAAEQSHRRRRAIAERFPGLGFWAGYVDGDFIGWWALEPVDAAQAESAAELGYRLVPRHWRRGLAGEGARELVRHGFENLGLERIVARTMAVNAASRATMTAIGMRHVLTFHAQWDEPIPGSEEGEVEYVLTRQEWLHTRDRR